MLRKLGLKGPQSTLEINPGRLTVVVGPNGSGKSTMLREIRTRLEGGLNLPIPERRYRVVALAEAWPSGFDEALEFIGPSTQKLALGNFAGPNYEVLDERRLKEVRTRQVGEDWLCSQIRRSQTILLDGNARLSVMQSAPIAYDEGRPQALLQTLVERPNQLDRLSALLHEAFGLYLSMEATSKTSLQARMTPEKVDIDFQRSFGPKALEFFRDKPHLGDFGDGVKAYAGILGAIVASEADLILIDEPEAFLHPPLQRRLGRALAELAFEPRHRERSLVVATHSPDILAGCLTKGDGVTVVRLDHPSKGPQVLPVETVRTLFRDPFLRSTNFLSALFHRFAVVCEADGDRAVYAEVNEKLLSRNEGITDCLFLAGMGKHSLAKAARPLRQMGIPAAVIVDLDMLNESRDIRSLPAACFIPDGIGRSIFQLRGDLHRALSQKGVSVKQTGTTGLDRQDRECAESLIKQLAEYGIFMVPVGELEGWLRYLNLGQRKPDWAPAALEALVDAEPTEDDIWEFIRGIRRWLGDQGRLGMPD